MNETSRLSIGTRVLAVYTILVSLVLVGQVLLSGFRAPSPVRIDAVVFFLVLLLGLAALPIWLFRPRCLPWLLTACWFPQLIAVTKNQYFANGTVQSIQEWKVALLFFVGPTMGNQVAPSTYRLVHLNFIAFAAVLILFFVEILPTLRGKRTSVGALDDSEGLAE